MIGLVEISVLLIHTCEKEVFVQLDLCVKVDGAVNNEQFVLA